MMLNYNIISITLSALVGIQIKQYNNDIMLADLHLHTKYSDGQLTPSSLLELIAHAKLNAMAITDHDHITISPDLELAAALKIKVITGVEVTCHWHGKPIHVLGLDLQLAQLEELEALLAVNRELRLLRAEHMDHYLTKQGYKHILQVIVDTKQPRSFCRSHFARVLCESYGISSMQEAFRKVLLQLPVPDFEDWPDYLVIANAIKAAGGIPVLAHPLKYSMDSQNLTSLLQDFSSIEGVGIELVSGQTTYRQLKKIIGLLAGVRIISSMGSDLHGTRYHKPFTAAKYANWLQDLNPIWNYWR